MRHVYTLTFDVQIKSTDEDKEPEMVDMSRLISAATEKLEVIKRNPAKHLEDFDFVETLE